MILEKHEDFFRDFRGDTIHPSTLQLFSELGLLDEFLKIRHDEMSKLSVMVDGEATEIADFTSLPTTRKSIVFMPQWDFLAFLARQGSQYPEFTLRMGVEATDVIVRNGIVVGVTAGDEEIVADLVIGADGRRSIVREKAGLEVEVFGVPIDVLWARIPKPTGLQNQSLGYFHKGQFMVLIDRTDYFQAGVLIKKGGLESIKEAGLPSFRSRVLDAAPFLAGHIEAITDWDQVKLLTVTIDRLKRWHRPGLLCIGDCAHAMSPAGGVGINLAIQDAVATANILTEKLLGGGVSDMDLHQVQQRRMFPTRFIQGFQVMLHRRIVNSNLSNSNGLKRGLALFRTFGFLRRLLARGVGLGVRSEHVQTPPKN